MLASRALPSLAGGLSPSAAIANGGTQHSVNRPRAKLRGQESMGGISLAGYGRAAAGWIWAPASLQKEYVAEVIVGAVGASSSKTACAQTALRGQNADFCRPQKKCTNAIC